MKDIDFLPEWYKTGRRRKVTYRAQYVALGGIFLIMMVWNFFTAHSISQAEAQLVQMTAPNVEAEAAIRRFKLLKSRIEMLSKQAASIEEIDSKINVAKVLAELSFLIDKRVVLSSVQLSAEKFAEAPDSIRSGRAVVRVVRAKVSEKRALPLGDVRFKVVINGVAADSIDVAAILRKLEDSPYFSQVVLLFTRDMQISRDVGVARGLSDLENRRPGARTTVAASEFEISCYLANYRKI